MDYNSLAMLKRLRIQNLAIIENVDVSFHDGFTVLTGGTGAGKSLVIDSLSLLLGARASSELIREGAEKATIEGVFEVRLSRLRATLAKLEIPSFADELTIERTIGRTKNYIKANGKSITLGELSEIASLLADIHSQFDVIKILNPENYLSIIDGYSFELVEPIKKEYTGALNAYKESKRKYEALLLDKKRLDENRDFLEYQYKELKAFNLSEGEEEEIEEELSRLKNFDKVYSLSKEAEEKMNSDSLDNLYELKTILGKLSSYMPSLKESSQLIEDRYYELDDLFKTLKKDFGRLDYDPDRLNELTQRSFDLSALKRKYKKDVPALIAYLAELEGMLGKDGNLETRLEESKKEMLEARKEAFLRGNDLSSTRKSLSASIEKEIKRNLKDLLLDVDFRISLESGEDDESLTENGIDKVDFLIETNVGEGMKSLSKVVSGGEASRIMLAFKAVFIAANRIETVIFDEIDTGVSGEAAYAVSKKIAEIALSRQVIAITHLPQVASFSDHHILISKAVRDGRTYTSIKTLDLEGKIKEIAHLISGGEITEKQLAYAKEMVMNKGN